jgi:hypothetical protein
MHIIYGHKHDLKMDDAPLSITSEPLLSRTTTSINISPTMNPVDEHDQSTSSDEITPLITRSEGKIDSGKSFISTEFFYLSFFSCTKFNQLLFIDQ